jgi:hypothetical protein
MKTNLLTTLGLFIAVLLFSSNIMAQGPQNPGGDPLSYFDTTVSIHNSPAINESKGKENLTVVTNMPNTYKDLNNNNSVVLYKSKESAESLKQ